LRGGFGGFGGVLVDEANAHPWCRHLTLDTFLRAFCLATPFFGEALFAGLILIWFFFEAVLAGALPLSLFEGVSECDAAGVLWVWCI
jgi:hypothetical protein